MSVPFGVDLGNNSTVIACAKNRGIDIVVNEVSNRATPSLVGFGPKTDTWVKVLRINKLQTSKTLLIT